MTLLALPITPPGWHLRTELELLVQQLEGVEAFCRAGRVREQAAAAAGSTRERRLDASRSLQVLRRQHEALRGRTDVQLRASGDVLHHAAQRRAVVAHRSEWFVREVSRVLDDCGVQVVEQVDNGADAVGLLVAEQPDLVLVEDALAMARGDEVVREARAFAPATLVAVHVAADDRVRPLVDAGAALVFPRLTRPRDVGQGAAALLTC